MSDRSSSSAGDDFGRVPVGVSEAARAGSPGLRRDVEALLRAHGGSCNLLDAADLAATSTAEPASESVGARIGPYKLLQQLGEGGMGAVYMAEQSEPMRRTVALKLIKAGMDSRLVLARFNAERQALALMDHPNIARVLDAGASESGRPYFVMELVKGIPITRFCDERRLTVRERLELMIPVCQAIQHAHQKGIIHRDLKPSNVLIALYDGKPVPKVIDFGVAKATGPRLTDQTLFTEFGSVVGTLEYMSPEQAQMNQLDIDTRSDIYSLGVVLYELLTGSTPLDRTRLRHAALLEVLQRIRDEEAPRPSIRLSTIQELPSVAAERGLDPDRLRLLIRGELDWIVMKCLDKDRDRRYGTTNDLARDIQRYLGDEPVQACPPSAAYRTRKFIRRNKRALVAASVGVAGLVLAVVGLAISVALTRQAKSRVEAALVNERLSSYFLTISLADREWSANNLAAARQILERCPPDLRGWEWRYLDRLRGRAIPPLRHRNGLYDCAMSPDGKQVVTCDAEGYLAFWDPTSGRELCPAIRGHDDLCYRVAFSPDGESFASAADRELKVWESRTRRLLRAWKPPAGTIQGLVFNHVGRPIVCVCEHRDGQEAISLWDGLSGELMFHLSNQQRMVHCLALSPDESLFATANGDGTVRLWDATSGKAVRTLLGDQVFWRVAFDHAGQLIAAAGGDANQPGGGQIIIWEVASGDERPLPSGHGAQCLAFSPEGDRLATGGSDQAVRIYDTASGQEVLVLRGHTDWIPGLVFTPDGNRLVSASGDRTARIWDASPWREGEQVGNELLTLDGRSGGMFFTAFHPTEPLVATASSDGSIRIWDTRTGRNLRTFRPLDRGLRCLAFDREGRRLAVGGHQSLIAILDTETGNELRRLDVKAAAVAALAFSPDGRHLASGDDEGFVQITEIENGSKTLRVRGAPFITAMKFSPDREGKLIAIGTGDGPVRIWETATSREIPASSLQHRGMISDLAFSADGRYLATASWDRSVRIWDTSSWRRDEVILDTAAALSIAFSPDGQSLAWGGSDTTLKVWRRATGDVHVFRGHLSWVTAVAFSPDGNVIASASRDGTAKIWEAPPPS
ncbi:MAG: protein kinase [Isosphaeraceae bacterium]